MNADAVLRIVTVGSLRLMAVIDKLNASLALGFWGVEDVGALPNFDTDSATVVDISGLASGAIVRKLTVNKETYVVNGWDANKIVSGTTIREAGADAAPIPTVAAGGAGSLTGSYTALYTYYDSARDFETAPAPTAPSLVTLASQNLSVSVVASSNTRFDKIRIYRNATAVPATYRRDSEVANATATVALTKADTALGVPVLFTNYRPPPCKYVAATATRIFWGGSKPFRDGTASFTNNSPTVTLSVAPPANMYTRNAEAPFYLTRKGGARYGITSIAGNVVTLASNYQGITEPGAPFVIVGLQTRVYYADLSTTGLIRSESWNPTNNFDLGLASDGGDSDFEEEMTGLRSYGNKIYAFMRESIWYFDPLLSQRKKTGAKTGTLSDKTIRTDRDENLLYMGSDMQVYAFNGTSTQSISMEVAPLFAAKNRFNLDLIEHAYAVYDFKQGLYQLYRPAYGCTLSAMRYVCDVYDDYSGKWTERVAPRLAATCVVRDNSRRLTLGIDTLGLVHIVDDYENSTSLVEDAFTASSPTVLTSVAGEISPGSNKKGKVAVIFTPTVVRGSKFIVGAQSASAQTEDLMEAVTVQAGDSYLIGAWHAKYETGWWDGGEPDLYKQGFYIEGTFIKNSAGYLYVSWYADESPTAIGTIRIDCATERKFKREVPARFKQHKFIFEGVSELVGWALRDLTWSIKTVGDV